MSPKKSKKIERKSTVEDVANEHGVAAETVRRWVRDGCPATRPGKGRPTLLNIAEVEVWKRENGISGERGRPSESSSPDIEAARLRKENALASKYELDVAEREQALVPIEDVKRWINDQVGAARNKFLGFGARFTPMLEGRDSGERQVILDDGIREVLNELAGSKLIR